MNNFKFWYNVMRCCIVLIALIILVVYPEIRFFIKYLLTNLIK